MCIGMRSGSFSRYYNVDSPIHKLNPLCKILTSIVFLVMVLISSRVKVIISLFLILSFIITISNVPFKYYLKPLFGMKVLFIFLFVINIIFGVSFYNSFVMICKIILVVMYSSVLLFTTTTNSLAYGFSSFLRPLSLLGLPVSKISMAIALSLNFIPTMFDSSNKIMKSQMSRGFNYKEGSFKDKIVGIKSIFIPMFVSSIKRADAVSDAMEVKNFSFDSDRSDIIDYRWRFNDFYMITSHLVLFILVLIKEVVM